MQEMLRLDVVMVWVQVMAVAAILDVTQAVVAEMVVVVVNDRNRLSCFLIVGV